MKILIFVALKIVEITALSLIWWIPWLLGQTRFAKQWTSACDWDNSANNKWGRGATVIGHCIALLAIALLLLLVIGIIGYGITIVNWQWASQIVEQL